MSFNDDIYHGSPFNLKNPEILHYLLIPWVLTQQVGWIWWMLDLCKILPISCAFHPLFDPASVVVLDIDVVMLLVILVMLVVLRVQVVVEVNVLVKVLEVLEVSWKMLPNTEGLPCRRGGHFRDGLATDKRRMERGWIKSKVPAEIVNPKSHYPFQVVSSTQLHWIAHSTSFKITHWGDFSPMKQHVSCDQSCHFHIQNDIRIHQRFPAKRAFRCAWLNESSHVSWKHVE